MATSKTPDPAPDDTTTDPAADPHGPGPDAPDGPAPDPTDGGEGEGDAADDVTVPLTVPANFEDLAALTEDAADDADDGADGGDTEPAPAE